MLADNSWRGGTEYRQIVRAFEIWLQIVEDLFLMVGEVFLTDSGVYSFFDHPKI